MTRIPLLAAIAAVFAFAAPVQAIDLTDMTSEERKALRAEIRAYLIDNPEVIMEAIEVLEERQAARAARDDAKLIKQNAEAVFDDGHSWVGGNPDGDVTLVEFMDYECGYCRRAFPEVESLIETDGDIRFIIKEFPILGEGSVLSSRFAIAVKQTVGDAAYKAVHDSLMSFKGEIGEPALRRIAKGLDLDPAPIMAHMNTDAVTDVIAQNHALARKLSISGTPTFIMEDRMLRGYVPLEQMMQIADEIRADD
ncbi:DsbA family protein [Roseovarius salinarum]|uniref:DsbA family protein n=1 Tax=Roseovarius salinarum TaxID=1981892 RepID=UPI000C33159F|nr:DsbA family protein [Roseovarius salinarum]